MAEYISREALIEMVNGSERPENERIDIGYNWALNDIKQRLVEMPATDAKPEIHAYWIRGKEFGFRTHNPMWYCSNCGDGIRYNTTLRTYEKHKKPVEEVNCFCRKCGAKMDLEPIYEREETNNDENT